LVQLQIESEKFSDAGIRVVGVSYDAVDKLKAFADSGKVKFPLLSDEGSAVIKAYGLEFKRGLPHPGTLIVDKDGVLRAKLFEDGYVKRHTPDDLIEAVKALKD